MTLLIILNGKTNSVKLYLKFIEKLPQLRKSFQLLLRFLIQKENVLRRRMKAVRKIFV